jgi:hypothetical protein
MTKKSGPEGSIAGSGVPAEEAAVEAKRLAARRRFLLGGASALPLIATLGTKEAWAASAAVCQSLNMSYDSKYAEAGGFSASLYCDPRQRWP